MICEKYLNMNPIERVLFIGQLNHAVQSDETLLDMANEIIALGTLKGVFEGVKILPEPTPIDNELNQPA